MRRRRGPKVTWLPTYGIEIGDEPDLKHFQGIEIGFEAPWQTQALGAVNIFPLTFDQPNGEDGPQAGQENFSLADAIGSEWFLRRIVGKLFLTLELMGEPPFQGPSPRCLIGAGFFVARADDDVATLPLGAGDSGLNPSDLKAWNNFSPLATTTVREPWIWRRKWILSVNGWDAGGTDGFPICNINYGISSLDGPHIDAKTKRRITNDERLFFAIATSAWPLDTEPDGGEEGDIFQVKGHLDYRMVGNLRKARNRGVF